MSEEIKDTEVTEQNNTEDKETRSFTEEELQKIIDSESDKKLDKALKTAKANWESDFEKKLEERIAEEKRIANLSEKERQEEELSQREQALAERDRKSTRLNSSHVSISYAVFCLKKKRHRQEIEKR